MSTRSRKALLPHNTCGKDCRPCTDCAYQQQVAIDEAKITSRMMKDQHEAHKEFRAQDCLQMLQMRQRLDEAYDDANAQRVQKVLATDQAAQLLNEKHELEVELAMAEGRLEGALETIADLKESLDNARREAMPVLEPRTPHKKRRTIRPTPVTPAPEPLPVSDDEDCFCREEEGSVRNPIKL
jgi:phosphoglycolate phosphatase-like HAD superfamily hydrolase